MPQVGVLLIVKHLTEKKSLDSFPFCSVLLLFTLLLNELSTLTIPTALYNRAILCD